MLRAAASQADEITNRFAREINAASSALGLAVIVWRALLKGED
jgi:hypothetical protein